ncbi:MAG TPA: TonB-dependent receptor [Steroidobacteraceae bacterium]
MNLHRMLGSARGPTPLACAVASILAVAAALPAAAQEGGGLEEIVVTAQRRETDLQTTPIAISAYSGETLAEDKIFSVSDLANSVPAFSLTALTPLDAELNIRGITNTRLDSPTADPSVGTFVDGVYIGRTGDYNLDFYDIQRIEVIRGPQGVLLGKNVVGGALSIITAAPKFETSGQALLGYGNYAATTVSGYVTGGITDSLAGRFSMQARKRDGFAEDVLHRRDVENLDSTQARAQLLWRPGDSGWSIRGIVDYNKDSTDGINTVAVAGGTSTCEQEYFRTNCTRPWSNVREYLGLTDPRKNVAQSLQLVGDKRRNQYLEREGWGGTLDIEKEFELFTFNSLTGYRTVESRQFYDQTGAGPEALGWSVAEWGNYIAWMNAKYGTRPATSNNGQFLFAQPVVEWVDGDQLSQEFRFTSNNPDSRIDWIAGLYGKQDNTDKTDHFKGENFLGAVLPGGNNPLSTLSGENRWINEGEVTNLAGFAQVGFKFTPALKLSVGVRYTQDEKEGVVDALVIETGDRFSPNDPRANVTIEALCRAPDGTIIRTATGGTGVATCDAPNRWIYSAGEGFRTNYSEKWTETTPQAILEWTLNEDWFLYATYAEGFKGGGFDDTPANVAQATTPFDPEKAKNYEIGFKSTLWERRMRLNAAFFMMDYTNLQVTQTNAACLCNITDNAASAEIKGVEAEFQLAPIETFRFFLSGSYVDAKYEDFIESAINPSTGTNLVSSGNQLQRTPDTQVSTGIDWELPLGSWGNALDFRVNYTWQSDMPWATDNIAEEDAYGLVDARIALSPDGAPWEVALWGKNLSDELYRVNIISFFGEEVSQFGPPRTYGVDFTVKF